MKRVLFAILALVILVSAGCQPTAPGDQSPVEVIPEATPAPTPFSLQPAGRGPMLAAGKWNIALLRSNGTVLAAGDNDAGQCNVQDWQNVVYIAAGPDTTAGVTGEGKLLIAGARAKDWEAALSWENIIKIAVGDAHIVGLKSDGTVVAAGDNTNGQCDVSLWKDVTDIKASAGYTLAKKADGSVLSAGSEPAEWDSPEAEIPEVKDGTWKDARQTVQTADFRAAILADGKIACAGNYSDLSNLTANWNADGDAVPEALDPNAEKQNAAAQKNSDVLGYLSVPGVDIDRPILYGKDWYYNTHDIDKKQSDSGEVYLYRKEKQQINAITAHNMRVSGTMFHELHHIQEYNNGLKNCQYDKCNAELTAGLPDLTKYSDRVWNISLFGFTRWEVFSYYEVKANEPETTLYYNTNFAKDPKTMNVEEWINIQTTRSEKKLDVDVTKEDTFLTILTCGDEHDSATAQSRLYIFLKAVG